jgi:hypothetical protein
MRPPNLLWAFDWSGHDFGITHWLGVTGRLDVSVNLVRHE